MAILKTEDGSVEVPDGARIKHFAEELGVPFGCRSGICGTCKIDVISGAENLGELNDLEQEMGDRDTNHRLACQCTILKGEVKIDFKSRTQGNVVFK